MLATLTWIDFGVVAAAATATFLFARTCAAPIKNAEPLAVRPNALSFEYDLSGALICSNLEASEFLVGLKLIEPDWPTLHAVLSNRFADLPHTISAHDQPFRQTLTPQSAADPMTLEIEHHANGLTLLIKEREKLSNSDLVAVHDVLSTLPNLSLVKAVSENAPFPVWQNTKDGGIGWSNAFYQTLDRRIAHEDGPLFDIPTPIDQAERTQRITLKDEASNRTHWFDVTRQRFEDGYINFAIDVHAVVKAETAQRNFVQTLAKTFAHLATGLAIFDRNRQLVLFNPSLLDLTELRPEFLTVRPNLFSFFDQLRDKQIMPEPKSYANWRERIADVITAASDDNFSETWHLPNGLTYRVTGRPHPDGAIAFLFEDISAEISLTRRFRSEADVTRSALDSMDQGIAIFNRAGFLQQSNSALSQFIGQQTEQDLENMSVRDVTRLCQRVCKPTPVWGEIRDFVIEGSEREAWSSHLQNKDGQAFDLKVSPLANGASLVTLTPALQLPAKSKRSIMHRKPIVQANSAVA